MASRASATLFAILALSVTAGRANARPSTTIVHRGQLVRLTGMPSGTPACLASVSYANGAYWKSSYKSAVLGKIAFTFRVPAHAALGFAHWTIRCGPTWSTSGLWRVAA